jgi:hypothetical protein
VLRSLNATHYLDVPALLDLAGQMLRIDPCAIVAVNPYALM